MARARHFSGDINHSSTHQLAGQHGTQAVSVVHTVLQTQDQRIGLQKRLHQAACGLGVARFDAKQHHICALHCVGVKAGLQMNVLVEGLGLQPQPGFGNRAHMLWPGNQHHIMSGPSQHAAVVAAHSARAHDGEF